MSKKSLIVILVLSVMVTYGVSIAADLMKGSVLSGEGGIPLKFTESSLFGGTAINLIIFLIDVIFWFIVIWIVWRLLSKLTNK